MKQGFQQKYNDSIKLISHLILTKPKPVIGLLAKHGILFKGTPLRTQLINEVVEVLKSNNEQFENDLGALLTTHIQFKGKEMLALERTEFNGYHHEEEEDAFWGALAKGAIGIVGGLFKKKKRGSRGGGGNNNAAAQAAQTKRDMQLLSMRMAESKRRREEERRREAERRRLEEARRQRELKAQRRREKEKREQEAARQRQNRTMLIAGGGIALLALVGVVLSKSNARPMYMQPQQMVSQ